MNVKHALLVCRDIPMIERYLISYSIIDNDFDIQQEKVDNDIIEFTVTDNNDFKIKFDYNKKEDKSSLIEVNNLDVILPSINLERMKQNINLR